MRLGDGEQDAQSPVAAGQDHAGVDPTDEQDERIRTSAPGEQAEEGGIKPVDGKHVHDTGAKGQDHANGRSRRQLNEQAAIEKGISLQGRAKGLECPPDNHLRVMDRRQREHAPYGGHCQRQAETRDCSSGACPIRGMRGRDK